MLAAVETTLILLYLIFIMKSVVVRRDLEGKPVWQVDYEAFMLNVGFKTKLCKPRHPFTKGKVERLVRFVKGNFLVGRTFWNVTDLNRQALEWCDKQNSSFRRAIFGVPNEMHQRDCVGRIRALEDSDVLREYLCVGTAGRIPDHAGSILHPDAQAPGTLYFL